MKSLRFLFLSFATTIIFAQKPNYSASLIPENLRENANAVVRHQSVQVNIASRTNMTIKTFRAVTIINELGVFDSILYTMFNCQNVSFLEY
jgi:hypothetical protein